MKENKYLQGDRLGEVCGVCIKDNMSKHYSHDKSKQLPLSLYQENNIFKMRPSGIFEPSFRSILYLDEIQLEKERPFPFRSGDINRLNVDEETGLLWLEGKPIYMFLSLEYLNDDSYISI